MDVIDYLLANPLAYLALGAILFYIFISFPKTPRRSQKGYIVGTLVVVLAGIIILALLIAAVIDAINEKTTCEKTGATYIEEKK